MTTIAVEMISLLERGQGQRCQGCQLILRLQKWGGICCLIWILKGNYEQCQNYHDHLMHHLLLVIRATLAPRCSQGSSPTTTSTVCAQQLWQQELLKMMTSTSRFANDIVPPSSFFDDVSLPLAVSSIMSPLPGNIFNDSSPCCSHC